MATHILQYKPGIPALSHLIMTVGDSNRQDYREMAIDGSDNIYLTGVDSDNQGTIVTKITPTGTIVWQKKIKGANNDYGFRIKNDQSGNLVLLATSFSTTPGQPDLHLIKMDANGNDIWQRSVSFGNGILQPIGLGIDYSSGDIYIGFVEGTVTFAKFNSAGTFQFAKRQFDIPGNSVGRHCLDIVVDSTGDVIVCGEYDTTAQTHPSGWLAKINSSLTTVEYEYIYGGGSSETILTGLAIDDSDNIYACGPHGGSPANSVLMKYNSSGVQQWERSISDSSTSIQYQRMVRDGSGNIHIIGKIPGASSYTMHNSSGVMQTQQRLTNADLDMLDIELSSGGTPILSGSTSAAGEGSLDGFIGILTTTGTYTPFVYEDITSLTDSSAVSSEASPGGLAMTLENAPSTSATESIAITNTSYTVNTY